MKLRFLLLAVLAATALTAFARAESAATSDGVLDCEHPPKNIARKLPKDIAVAAAIGGPQFAVWSGGLACVAGVGVLLWRVPELWRDAGASDRPAATRAPGDADSGRQALTR